MSDLSHHFNNYQKSGRSKKRNFLNRLSKRTKQYIAILFGVAAFVGHMPEAKAQTNKPTVLWENFDETITVKETKDQTPIIDVTPLPDKKKEIPIIVTQPPVKKDTEKKNEPSVKKNPSFLFEDFDETITVKEIKEKEIQNITVKKEEANIDTPPKNTIVSAPPVQEEKKQTPSISGGNKNKSPGLTPPKDLLGDISVKKESQKTTTSPTTDISPRENTSSPTETGLTLVSNDPNYLEIMEMRKDIMDMGSSLSNYTYGDPELKVLEDKILQTMNARIDLMISAELRKDPKILTQELDKTYLGNSTYEQLISTIISIKDIHLQKAFLKKILRNQHSSMIEAQELFGMQDRNKLSKEEKNSRTYKHGNFHYVYYPFNLIQYSPTRGKDSYYVLLKKIQDNSLENVSSSESYKPYVFSSYKLSRLKELSSTRTYMTKNEILSAPETEKDALMQGLNVVVPDDVKKSYKEFLSNPLRNKGKNYSIVSKTNFKIYLFTKDHILVGCNDILLGATKGDQQNNPFKGIYTTPGGRYIVGDKFVDATFIAKYRSHYISFLPLDGQYELKQNKDGKLIYTLGIHGLYTNDLENRGDAIHSSLLSDKRKSKGCGNVDTDEFDQIYDHLSSGCIIDVADESSEIPNELLGN